MLRLLIYIYFKDGIKNRPKRAQKALFIGVVESPQGLALQNIARVSRVKTTTNSFCKEGVIYDQKLKTSFNF